VFTRERERKYGFSPACAAAAAAAASLVSPAKVFSFGKLSLALASAGREEVSKSSRRRKGLLLLVAVGGPRGRVGDEGGGGELDAASANNMKPISLTFLFINNMILVIIESDRQLREGDVLALLLLSLGGRLQPGLAGGGGEGGGEEGLEEE